jgi:hypothetical protein
MRRRALASGAAPALLTVRPFGSSIVARPRPRDRHTSPDLPVRFAAVTVRPSVTRPTGRIRFAVVDTARDITTGTGFGLRHGAS